MVCYNCRQFQLDASTQTGHSNKKEKKSIKRVSGYIIFFQERRSELATQMNLENRKHTDAVREIGKMWKALSLDEKEYYNLIAKN